MFGGAYSGTYQVEIRYKDEKIDTTGVILTVGSKVTSYSPQIGSMYGGTLLTIHGTNFGKEITDNPVQISYNGALGSTHCYLQTIEQTKITCRIEDFAPGKEKHEGKNGTMIVFQKTSEEAACTYPTCTYNFTDSIPVLTNITPEFDV